MVSAKSVQYQNSSNLTLLSRPPEYYYVRKVACATMETQISAQFFPLVLFIMLSEVVLTFESVGEILLSSIFLWCCAVILQKKWF